MVHQVGGRERRLPSRIGLGVLLAVSVLVLIVAVLYGLLATSWAYEGKMGDFFVELAYVTEGQPRLASSSEIWVNYSTVAISSYEALVVPRTMAAVRASIPFLIVVAGSLSVIVLSTRILKGKPFSRAAQICLAVLSAFLLIGAVLRPWLSAQIGQRTAVLLGLPQNGDEAGPLSSWVVPPYFDLLQDMDWPLFTTGVVLLVVAFLWSRAARFQHDQEGLV